MKKKVKDQFTYHRIEDEEELNVMQKTVVKDEVLKNQKSVRKMKNSRMNLNMCYS